MIFGVTMACPAPNRVPSSASLWRGYLLVIACRCERNKRRQRRQGGHQFVGVVALPIEVLLVGRALPQDRRDAVVVDALRGDADTRQRIAVRLGEPLVLRGREAALKRQRLQRAGRIVQERARRLRRIGRRPIPRRGRASSPRSPIIDSTPLLLAGPSEVEFRHRRLCRPRTHGRRAGASSPSGPCR